MLTFARRATLLTAAALAAAVFSIGTPAQSSQTGAQGTADELLPVDCLLPGKVRKLGSKLTYMSPRAAVKTTALDCEIRGGEYVSYDRATYESSLAVWLPQAQQGDPKAQNYVGEIYERGLGTQPNYTEAALWYRKAAEQGHGPAQVNLGQLYETGRGVPQDSEQAIAWYRRASGLEDLFVASASDAEVKDLRRQLSARTQELEALRGELRDVQDELESSRDQRDRRRSEVEQDQAQLEAARKALAAEVEDLAREREELQAKREALEAQREQSTASAEARAEVDKMAATLVSRAQALEERAQEVERRESEVESREAEIAEKQTEVARLDAEIESLREQAAGQREQMVAMNDEASIDLPGPSIHLIDPVIPVSRSGGPVLRLAQPMQERMVVGKVEAPAGLLSVMVNDVEAEVKENGIFQTRVSVLPDGSHVTIIAIDQQGKRDERDFTLIPPGATEAIAKSEPSQPKASIPDIDWGNYYALVIGNQNYPKLPNLETAFADADAVAGVLEKKYGFDVTVVKNASRYQILSALNELRGKLTEKDNLLIYYAGHGELDEVNMRGHWLPVDAEPDNTANWISNVSLTDLLNAINARHVLVVADSCYSGALTRSALARLERGLTNEARESWQKKMNQNRSRVALTSGGLKPVLDGGGGQHSIFAKAFLQVLEQNDGVLEGQRLFSEISALVTWAAEAQRFDQTPQYAPIKYAGHESGDFFFVPRG